MTTDITRPLAKLDMTETILAVKHNRRLSWAALAEAAGMSDVFVVSACLGQNTLPAAAAEKLCAFLGLGTEFAECLQRAPKKAQTTETVSKDPLIYRFHEITYVYGDTIKELIHEKFGDGIMSAIDFDMSVERVPHPKGDRVKVTMSGKYLAYNQW